nr:efflux RND transporter permease subunit [Burkholderiaceae bacterium]
MIGPNLSEWAIKRRSLVIFLMLVAVVAGTLSFLRLGRAEDPVFTFRTMVVFAAWPGASQEETLLQVTERIERKLQETRHLDNVRSYTVPGFTTMFVDLKGSTPPEVVPDVWYQVRKNISDIRFTLPQGVIGPGFNDDFGDTFGIIYGFTADGFTERELRDYVEAARSRLLLVPDVSKIDVLGAQDERIFIEFSTERLAGLGLDFPTLLATLQQQNIVRPAGVIETSNERIAVRVSGAFDSEEDIAGVNFNIDGRMVRLGDLAVVRRGFVDPPQPMFRVNGIEAIGLAIAMRDGGDILAMGENIDKAMAEIKADLPHGIEATLVADQAVTVDTAIGEFMTSLWQAILIILACSFLALGVRPGAVVALAIPLTLAIVFSVMEVVNIDLQRISLGALIIALTLLVDDAMTTVDAMLRRLAAGDTKEKAATFAYSTLAAPMLAGTLITIAGFVPIGFAKSSAGEYTFSIFAVVGIALVVSWFVAVIFAPVMGMAILKPPKAEAAGAKPSRLLTGYTRFLE